MHPCADALIPSPDNKVALRPSSIERGLEASTTSPEASEANEGRSRPARRCAP
jgi:hypothetical protein